MLNAFRLIVIIIEALYLYYLFGGFSIKCKKSTLWTMYGIYLILWALLPVNNMPSLLVILLRIGTMYLFFKMIYDISELKVLGHIGIYFAVLGCADALGMGISMLVRRVFDSQMYMQSEQLYIEAAIMSKAIAFVLFLLIKKRQLQNIIPVDKKEASLIYVPIFINTMIIIVATFTVFRVNLELENFSRVFVIFVVGMIMLNTICIAILTQYYLTTKHKAMTLEHLQNRMEYQTQYYESKKDAEKEIRKIYHDLKNYMLYFQMEDDKKSQNVQSIVDTLKSYEVFVHTNNDILDTLITEKYTISKRKFIHMQCVIDFKDGYFIKPLDICAIFGNLIDNAIEACDKIEGSNKYIHIKACTIETFLVIKIINSTNSQAEIHNNSVRTTKSNKWEHGYGLLSVQESLKKYQGELTLSATASEFKVNILLPLQQQVI